MALAEQAAVAAYLFQTHGELSEAIASVQHRHYEDVVMMQLRHRGDMDEMLTLARCARVLGIEHIELAPQKNHVEARAVCEIEIPAGAARVEVWTHLDVWQAAHRAAVRFGVTLSPDGGPVFIEVAHVLRVLGAVA